MSVSDTIWSISAAPSSGAPAVKGSLSLTLTSGEADQEAPRGPRSRCPAWLRLERRRRCSGKLQGGAGRPAGGGAPSPASLRLSREGLSSETAAVAVATSGARVPRGPAPSGSTEPSVAEMPESLRRSRRDWLRLERRRGHECGAGAAEDCSPDGGRPSTAASTATEVPSGALSASTPPPGSPASSARAGEHATPRESTCPFAIAAARSSPSRCHVISLSPFVHRAAPGAKSCSTQPFNTKRPLLTTTPR
mmetsp:Transcript_107847/g.310684  ORF Transcript_107847/g.310684 Transcript_107847/m.310684 type:complete len:250 (+) Transcript_107847:545-1294(+)